MASHLASEVAQTTITLANAPLRMAANMAESMSNIIKAGAEALSSLCSIPYVGPILGIAAMGAVVANKAAAVDSLYSKQREPLILQALDSGVKRGELAAKQLPDYANAHYTLALVLGRYSQRISILRALAEGLAGRVQSHLQRAVALQPRHAEAHVALGLYHAEIIGKLGALAAGLTYGASRDEAIKHFEQAIKFAPASPIVHMEYANGLRLLDAAGHRARIHTLYKQAAHCEPADAMERLDTDRAKRGVV